MGNTGARPSTFIPGTRLLSFRGMVFRIGDIIIRDGKICMVIGAPTIRSLKSI